MKYHTSHKIFRQKQHLTKFKVIVAKSGLLSWNDSHIYIT